MKRRGCDVLADQSPLLDWREDGWTPGSRPTTTRCATNKLFVQLACYLHDHFKLNPLSSSMFVLRKCELQTSNDPHEQCLTGSCMNSLSGRYLPGFFLFTLLEQPFSVSHCEKLLCSAWPARMQVLCKCKQSSMQRFIILWR